MLQTPLVTVICLCYNQEEFVVKSLDSVLNQLYPSVQLIVMDDCSTDNSKSVIKTWSQKHPDIQIIFNDTNLGNTKAFNKALRFAKGEYIIDLAADDILLPNCIMTQIDRFTKSPYKNLGVVYGNAAVILEDDTFDSYYFPVNDQKKVLQKRITGDIYSNVLSDFYSMCSVSAMIKKTVLTDLQGYDEKLAYEDLDFWIRASRKYEFDFIDEIIMQKRIVHNSLASNFKKKKDPQTKKFDYSTYLILKKAIQLNKSKLEDLSVQKRVHNGIVQCLKNRNYWILCKNLELRLLLTWRKWFKNYSSN